MPIKTYAHTVQHGLYAEKPLPLELEPATVPPKARSLFHLAPQAQPSMAVWLVRPLTASSAQLKLVVCSALRQALELDRQVALPLTEALAAKAPPSMVVLLVHPLVIVLAPTQVSAPSELVVCLALSRKALGLSRHQQALPLTEALKVHWELADCAPALMATPATSRSNFRNIFTSK